MTDREQPHSIRAEQRVLDAMMGAGEPATIDAITDVVSRSDFYQERHADLFDVVVELHKEDAPTSADAVAERLAHRDAGSFARMGGGAYLASVIALSTPPVQGAYWAGIVVQHAATRAAQAEATRYAQIVESGDPDRIAAERLRLVEQWSSAPARVAGPRAVELDAYLAADEPDRDPLIPGLIDRADRVILTAGEGRGKSTLLRQIGVQAASGIHPFGGDEYEPLRVLRLDVENGERRERRELRPLRLAAGGRYAGGMVVISRIEGLDLTRQADADWLLGLADQHDPDLLITGPAYKMHAGDPTEETSARIVAGYLDRIRALHGCAILLEAHSPHAANGGRRPTRPYGASYWLRWPEFGLNLGDDGALTHWRGPRDERDWPALLRRGGPWPWTPVTRDRDILWTRIRALCVEAGGQLGQRDLARLTDKALATVQRAIDEHPSEWAALSSPQVVEGGSA